MKRLDVIWLEETMGQQCLIGGLTEVGTYVHGGRGLWWMCRDHTD